MDLLSTVGEEGDTQTLPKDELSYTGIGSEEVVRHSCLLSVASTRPMTWAFGRGPPGIPAKDKDIWTPPDNPSMLWFE